MKIRRSIAGFHLARRLGVGHFFHEVRVSPAIRDDRCHLIHNLEWDTDGNIWWQFIGAFGVPPILRLPPSRQWTMWIIGSAVSPLSEPLVRLWITGDGEAIIVASPPGCLR